MPVAAGDEPTPPELASQAHCTALAHWATEAGLPWLSSDFEIKYSFQHFTKNLIEKNIKRVEDRDTFVLSILWYFCKFCESVESFFSVNL